MSDETNEKTTKRNHRPRTEVMDQVFVGLPQSVRDTFERDYAAAKPGLRPQISKSEVAQGWLIAVRAMQLRGRKRKPIVLPDDEETQALAQRQVEVFGSDDSWHYRGIEAEPDEVDLDRPIHGFVPVNASVVRSEAPESD